MVERGMGLGRGGVATAGRSDQKGKNWLERGAGVKSDDHKLAQSVPKVINPSARWMRRNTGRIRDDDWSNPTQTSGVRCARVCWWVVGVGDDGTAVSEYAPNDKPSLEIPSRTHRR